MDKRYYSFNEYCQRYFGEKVYRLSLNGGMTCPNRDGSIGTGGCAFCSEGGSGDFASNATLPIREQLAEAKSRIRQKTTCRKFIAYFQAYTNTYAPVHYLEDIFTEAINEPDIVAISIGTRSDCLPDEVISLLSRLSRIKPVWIELGFQTMHNDTHRLLSTGSTVEQFADACSRLHQAGIPVIAHAILGLPGEDTGRILDSMRFLSQQPISGIKLQLLHILRGTALAKMYEPNPFPILSMEEYAELVIDCLELLPPDVVIHRLTGDGPRSLLVAPLWSTDKKRVLNTINQRLISRNTRQGRLYVPS